MNSLSSTDAQGGYRRAIEHDPALQISSIPVCHTAESTLPARCQHRHREVRRVPRRAIYPLCRLLEIRFLGQKDIRHKALRIPIDHWKPRALHLHHDAVAFQKSMIVRRETDLVARHGL